jgi:hypothetical protein
MSKTKNFHSQLFEERQDFVTDDTYEDFMKMQKDQHERTEMELVQQHEGSKSNRSMRQAVEKINDLPF